MIRVSSNALQASEGGEIACDESGFAGGNLVGPGSSPVFTHASVLIGRDDAAAVIDHVHTAIGAKGGEYKAAELLRHRHRHVAEWLIDPTGPVASAAHIHLIDTRLFVLARVVDVLFGEQPVAGIELPGADPRLRELALTLYRFGAETYGAPAWSEFLTTGANLFRTNRRWLPTRPVDRFYGVVEGLAAKEQRTPVGALVERLRETRPVAEAARDRLLGDRRLSPLMQPLVPAVLRTAELWARTRNSVTLIHDEQSGLTPARIIEMQVEFAARHPGHELAAIRRLDSRDDPRIQVADFLAGIGARLGHAWLQQSADLDLKPLLDPLLDSGSLWPDPL